MTRAVDELIGQWQDRPLPELVAHIVSTYHAPIGPGLPILERMMDRATRDTPSSGTAGARSALQRLRENLEHHVAREERTLFAVISAGSPITRSPDLERLEADHRECVRLLDLLRHWRMSGEVRGAVWQPVLDGLAALDEATMEHMALEDQVLIPRALAAVRDPAG